LQSSCSHIFVVFILVYLSYVLLKYSNLFMASVRKIYKANVLDILYLHLLGVSVNVNIV
jgi:hypothetical protein